MRSAATGSDDPIPTGRALVATWPGRQTLAAHLRPGSVDGAAGGRRLGRPEADLLDSGNTELAAEQPHHRVTPEITGPLVVLIGSGLLLWGQSRSFSSIQQALAPDKDTVLVDALRAKPLEQGPNIVAIGGGTGLSTLLSGLKRYSSHITAIVTVADDGGSRCSAGNWGVLPPGDIRNCLAALSTEEPLLTRLFQCRTAGSGLEGTASAICFSLPSQRSRAIWKQPSPHQVVCWPYKVRVPATNVDVRLWAELENGQRIEGESNIGHAPSPIVRLGCSPERPPALPRALEAIANADLIVPDRAAFAHPCSPIC